MSRRTLISVASAAALLLAWWGWNSFAGDQAALELQLRKAAQVAQQNPSEARNTLSQVARFPLALSVPELGRRELDAEATSVQLQALGQRVIQVRGLELRVDGRQAVATGTLVISESQQGDLHAQERSFRSLWRKDARWQLTQLELQAARKHIPEARP